MKTFKTCFFVIASFLAISTSQTSACSFSASFTGTTMICAGTSVKYLSSFSSGHYYRWAVNNGTIVSGQGTDSLWVNWAIPGNGSVMLVDSTPLCSDSITKTILVEITSAILTNATYNVEGSATAPSSGRIYTLTQDGTGSESAAAWNNYRINLNKNFDFTFITNQKSSGSPADGMMFIIQNAGNTVYNSGSGGGSMGYYNASSGLMNQSIGLEEDIYLNSGSMADSSASHLNLVKNDSFKPLRPQINISPVLSNGADRKLRITWNRDANLFEVYFDGKKEYSWPNDIVKNVFKGNPNVWFGFTGGTGGLFATQTIKADTLIYNQAVINLLTDTICSGDSIKLTSSYGVSYLWSTGAKTRSIKTLKTGTYTVTVTDSFGCATTASFSLPTIVILTPVSASFTVSSGCLGSNISIINKTTPTTGVRYRWSFGNGASGTGNPPTYQYPATGSYTISVSATNGGCTSTASNPITIYTHPGGIAVSKSLPFQGQFNAGDVVTPDNVCIGDTNTIQFSAPSGLSNSDYGSKWVIASKTFATAAGTINTDTVFKNPTSTKNAYFKFFPGSAFADSVLILTMHVQLLPGNCDTLFTRYIQVRPNAASKFVFANTCEGFAVAFHDTSTISSGDAIINWNWDFGDGLTSALQNPQHTYAKPGSYKVTLLATSNANCGIPVIQTVSEYPKPVAAFHPAPGCQGKSSVFTDSSSIATGTIATRKWSFGDGNTSTAKSPTNVYAKPGTYQVKLVVTSALGCKDSITKTIKVQATPTAAFNVNKITCVGTPMFMTNKSSDSSTYNWTFGDGASSTVTSPGHTFAANGTYKVKLTVTSKSGCIDSTSQKITPYAETVPNIVFSGACTKNAVAFGDSDNNDAGATYSWNFGDGATDVASLDTDSHVYSKGGVYKVSLKIANGDGCVDTSSKNVTINDYPVASFTSLNVCEGKAMTFNNASTGGVSYSWYFGDTTSGTSDFSTLQNPTHIYDTAGTYPVILAVKGAGGCTDTFSQNAIVAAPPIVGKWNYKIHNQDVSFTPKDTTQKTYKWYFGTGDSSSTKKPVYTYKTKGKYGVKLVETNSTGCSAFFADSVTLTGAGVEPISGPKNNLNISIYPNPFESKTSINYTLTEDSRVNVSVYDIRGKLVAELRNGNLNAGKYQDEFDASKCNATDGVYLVKMTVNGEVFTGRIVEMK